MKTPIHSFAEHRQMLNNLRIRLVVSLVAVAVFTALCFSAWTHHWSGFLKFISIAGVVAGVVAIAADLPALRAEQRAIRKFNRNKRPA